MVDRLVQRKPLLITVAGRFDLLDTAIRLRPHFIDLDLNAPPEHFRRVQRAGIRLIVSYHNYEKMPDVGALLRAMRRIDATFYKIAVKVDSAIESFDVLDLSADDVIAIPMGACGQFGRILAPVFGQPLSYTAIEPFAPGQLSAKQLESYRFSDLKQTTQLYGLIGDPIVQSPSHITHNRAFHALGDDAVYVKIPVRKHECSVALRWLHRRKFLGLSVTMPLKKSVKEGGVYNTLKWARSGYQAFNTDGFGALEAIEKRMRVEGKRIVVLGSGGCGRAVAAEGIRRGARVVLVGRDEINRGDLPKGDVLVQATPVGMQLEDPLVIDPSWVDSGTLFLETIHTPEWTPLRSALHGRGCCTIGGMEMFFLQAQQQFLLWK